MFNALQTLARSNNAQIMYHRAKELGTLRLFNNDTDLSQIQITYLYYLELFSMLYTDLQMEEPYISEQIIEDPIRVEAYLLYRRINRKNKNQKSNTKGVIDTAGQGSLIFKRKKI